jgi:hypothetical protein
MMVFTPSFFRVANSALAVGVPTVYSRATTR